MEGCSPYSGGELQLGNVWDKGRHRLALLDGKKSILRGCYLNSPFATGSSFVRLFHFFFKGRVWGLLFLA